MNVNYISIIMQFAYTNSWAHTHTYTCTRANTHPDTHTHDTRKYNKFYQIYRGYIHTESIKRCNRARNVQREISSAFSDVCFDFGSAFFSSPFSRFVCSCPFAVPWPFLFGSLLRVFRSMCVCVCFFGYLIRFNFIQYNISPEFNQTLIIFSIESNRIR